MEEWKEYKLGGLSDIQTGPFGSQLHQCDYVDEGTPCIMPTNIGSQLDILSEGIAKVKDEDIERLKKHCVKAGDIVYSRRGDIEKCAFITHREEGWLCGTGCLRIRIVSEKVNPHFIAYQLSTKECKRWIVGNAVGTTMLNLNTGILKELPLSIPNKQQQDKIVSILKSLDDKIDVNHKINENLEQQAQALFKSWFVDFEPFKDQPFVESELGMIPQGWRVEVLGDVCKCILGGTPSRNKKEYWNGDIAWINSGEINEFRIVNPSEYITEEGLKHSATKLLPKKTTVLAITGATLGQVSLLEIGTCANQSVIGVLENDNVPYEFIYPLINIKITELCSHMTGGAQQHINKNNVEQLKIVLPSGNFMAEYKEKTKPIYSQITNCCFESRRLAELRDTLLPRLMSGEIKINDINS